MGLAASQARFLAITSRKANCEFQSMGLAQQKLSVTRNMAKVSQNYQNALNQTKLVWDFDGTNENPYNLSYGVLMTPTDLNNYNPYLITNRTGAVVLNNQFSAAARLISPDGKSTSRSAAGFDTFMNALKANGIVTNATVEDITDITNTTYKKADGTSYVDKNGKKITNLTAEEMKAAGVTVDYKGFYNKDAGYGATPLNKNGAVSTGIFGLMEAAKSHKIGEQLQQMINDGAEIRINGQTLDVNAAKEMTLSDLLSQNIAVAKTWGDGDHDPAGKEIAGVKELFGIISNAFKSILGFDGVDIPASAALSDAYGETLAKFIGGKHTISTELSDTASKNKAFEFAGIDNSYVFIQNDGSKLNSSTGINLSNLTSYFLTAFELSLNGYNSDYTLGGQSNNSHYVTDDPNYSYIMKDKNSVDNTTIMKADFYMQMYNNICINGWTDSFAGVLNDEKSFSNLLKNGQLFVTSLNGDGYFYQGRYNETDCVIEIKDNDAITQAEAEFTSQKSRLTYKEQSLDLAMKNLDTEISALTTEYDSVKNLISKNVEKIFTMFQS